MLEDVDDGLVDVLLSRPTVVGRANNQFSGTRNNRALFHHQTSYINTCGVKM